MLRALILLMVVPFAGATSLTTDGLWYSHDSGLDHPKYSGALATATAKTMPTAMRGGNGKNYYTWSECKDYGAEDEFRVYVGMTDGTKALVHRSRGLDAWGYCDQHDNAAIRVASDGYIWVHKSARGSWRKSIMYKSNEPWDITKGFKVVETGYRAYPQSWSLALIYTKYDDDFREPYVMAANCDKKLVEGGHYNISVYDGNKLHLYYNHHVDGDVDRRRNIYYMYTVNGCDWYNKSGAKLALPLASDSDLTKVYDSDTFNTYLKDVRSNGNGADLLYVESSTNDPLVSGTRELYTIDQTGAKTYITSVGHNYDSGCFMSDKYIVTPISNQFGYAGGDLHIYRMGGEYLSTIYTKGAANYCKKIFAAPGMIYSDSVSSESSSSVDVIVYK